MGQAEIIPGSGKTAQMLVQLGRATRLQGSGNGLLPSAMPERLESEALNPRAFTCSFILGRAHGVLQTKAVYDEGPTREVHRWIGHTVGAQDVLRESGRHAWEVQVQKDGL